MNPAADRFRGGYPGGIGPVPSRPTSAGANINPTSAGANINPTSAGANINPPSGNPLTDRVEFEVIGVAQPQGSKTTGQAKSGRRFVRESNKSLPGWRQLVADQAQRHAPAQPFEGPIMLTLQVWLPVPKSAPKRRQIQPTTKPDASKLARAVEDALEKIFYLQDAQITCLIVEKRYAYNGPPRARISVSRL